MFGHSSSVLKRCTLAESLFLLAENSQNIGITSISISWKISKIHPMSDKKKATKSTDSIAKLHGLQSIENPLFNK